MSKKHIDKSPELRQKEAELETLQAKIKKTQTTLKSLKTRLQNTQAEAQDIERKLALKQHELQSKFRDGWARVLELTKKLLKDKRFSKAEREELKNINKQAKEWMQDFEASTLEGQAEFEQRLEEEWEARGNNPFQAFAVAPPKAEQKEIRQVYLRLSKQFHPDRAKTAEEGKTYEAYQQQIVQAYERNDIQTLLEFEALFGQSPESPQEQAHSTDVLDDKISRLKHQLKLLEQQKDRLSQEIKQLRQSPMGQMLTSVKSMQKDGITLEEGVGLDEVEEGVTMVNALCEALEEADKDGNIDKLIAFSQQMLLRQLSLFEEEGEEDDPLALMSRLVNGDLDFLDEDGFGFFSDDDDEYLYPPNINAKFPEGSLVRVTSGHVNKTYEIDGQKHTYSLKGATGIVTSSFFHVTELDEEPMYHIEFDEPSLLKLPDSLIAYRPSDFQEQLFVPERSLALVERKPTPHDSEHTYLVRSLVAQTCLNDLPKEQYDRIHSLMTSRLDLGPLDIWLKELEGHISLPFKAKTRGLFETWKGGLSAKVLNLAGLDIEEGGIIVSADIKGVGHEDYVPLGEFEAVSKRSPYWQLLEDYSAWSIRAAR